MKNLKIRTLNQVVVIISVIFSILDVIVAILHGTPWWAWIATAICTYLITYYLTKFLIRQYVVYRIKPLYQLLLSKDIHTSRLSEELRKAVSDDVVDDIQENLNHLISFSESEIERLRRKDAEMTEFLAAIAHEVRTPVFHIQAYAETLLENWREDPAIIPQFATRILSSSDRLASMIEDIDKLSYYESGGAVVHKDYFDLEELVAEVVDAQILALAEKDLTVRIIADSFDYRPITVYAERLRIFLAIQQILMNAITYSHKGGLITIGLLDMFDKAMVEITDRGVGIPPEDLARIFEKLYRVDKSRSRTTGGSGMGLALVKTAMDDHGEHITARSETGVGTTISFTLIKRKAEDGREGRIESSEGE